MLAFTLRRCAHAGTAPARTARITNTKSTVLFEFILGRIRSSVVFVLGHIHPQQPCHFRHKRPFAFGGIDSLLFGLNLNQQLAGQAPSEYNAFVINTDDQLALTGIGDHVHFVTHPKPHGH